jgi:tripartite-type tricarboxylate transporter receptor subunit TctC
MSHAPNRNSLPTLRIQYAAAVPLLRCPGSRGARLGQQFVIDNRPGAAAISAPAVVKAPPDGYTTLATRSRSRCRAFAQEAIGVFYIAIASSRCLFTGSRRALTCPGKLNWAATR